MAVEECKGEVERAATNIQRHRASKPNRVQVNRVLHTDAIIYHDQVDGPGERNAGNARQRG